MHKYGEQIFWQDESHFTGVSCETVPGSHENPEQSIALFKVRNYSNTFSLSLRFWSGVHHLKKTTLLRTKLDDSGISMVSMHSPQVIPLPALSCKEVVQFMSRRQKREINTAEIITPGNSEFVVVKTSIWLWQALSETVSCQTGRINERRHKGAKEKESKSHFLSHNIVHCWE